MAEYEIGEKHAFVEGIFQRLTGGTREAKTYTCSGSLEDAKSEAARISQESGRLTEVRKASEEPGISPYEDGEAWFRDGKDVTGNNEYYDDNEDPSQWR